MVLYYCPMIRFSAAEIREIDKIWRGLPAEHSWSGWAVVGVGLARSGYIASARIGVVST